MAIAVDSGRKATKLTNKCSFMCECQALTTIEAGAHGKFSWPLSLLHVLLFYSLIGYDQIQVLIVCTDNQF